MWHLWLCVDDGMLLPARMLDVEEILVVTLNEYRLFLPRDGTERGRCGGIWRSAGPMQKPGCRVMWGTIAAKIPNLSPTTSLKTTRIFLGKTHEGPPPQRRVARERRTGKGPRRHVTSQKGNGLRTLCLGATATCGISRGHMQRAAAAGGTEEHHKVLREWGESHRVCRRPDWKYRYMEGTRHSDTGSGVWRTRRGRASSGSRYERLEPRRAWADFCVCCP
ncbi:hypothetical protein CSOJ01_10174 [Colletotrichum sojae]|uniref:Uncharacterized protein n=1 Tax=Colletotrichum sojae TaxID=2175907 RepID=A0A8H6J0V3_9PEZI|nr:hypothetical protein CSOJ01_10174 [Colletotrichum sojae]